MGTVRRDPAVDERLVARLWDAQRPFLLPLRTVAGEEVRVVYRGRRRFDRGPDFPGALISLPDEVPRRGRCRDPRGFLRLAAPRPPP